MDLDTLHEQFTVRHDENEIINIARSARDNLQQTLTADQSDGAAKPANQAPDNEV